MKQEIREQSPHTEPDDWRLYRAVTPRRSITGLLVFGLVWRQRQDGRWIYMQTDEQVKAAVELVEAAQRSRRSRRLRKS
jgi:hypothetical protein